MIGNNVADTFKMPYAIAPQLRNVFLMYILLSGVRSQMRVIRFSQKSHSHTFSSQISLSFGPQESVWRAALTLGWVLCRICIANACLQCGGSQSSTIASYHVLSVEDMIVEGSHSAP